MPELLLRLKSAGEKVYCHKISDIWLDLGRPEDFQTAQEIFRKHRKKFPFVPH
jgi:NDP-sugar pyrophosphorylase family protein